MVVFVQEIILCFSMLTIPNNVVTRCFPPNYSTLYTLQYLLCIIYILQVQGNVDSDPVRPNSFQKIITKKCHIFEYLIDPFGVLETSPENQKSVLKLKRRIERFLQNKEIVFLSRLIFFGFNTKKTLCEIRISTRSS